MVTGNVVDAVPVPERFTVKGFCESTGALLTTVKVSEIAPAPAAVIWIKSTQVAPTFSMPVQAPGDTSLNCDPPKLTPVTLTAILPVFVIAAGCDCVATPVVPDPKLSLLGATTRVALGGCPVDMDIQSVTTLHDGV